MKCPKCNEEIAEGVKFCTKCGANIEEELKLKEEAEKKKQEEIEKKKKAQEDKKKLEEIRKQEELKRQEEIKEAEKAEAIRKAKEEGIELEIIDQKPEVKEEALKSDFKVKKEKAPKEETKQKKQKVRIKKNIFQIIFGKILFIIIVAALIIGGVYYCYKQNLLPEFAQKQVTDFENKLQNVIKLNEEVKEGRKNLSETEENAEDEETEKEEQTENELDADEIRELTEEVSVIVKDGKEGLIDNKTKKIVLEPKYTQVLYTEYYEVGKTEEDKEEGIVIKDIEKFYKIDSDYKVGAEVTIIANSEKEVE